MNTITVKKIILLSTIFTLSVILMIQVVIGGKDSSRIIIASSPVDSIVVTKADTSVVVLQKTGDVWTVGSQESTSEWKLAEQSAISPLIEAAGRVKILGTVSAGGNDEKFGFEEASPVTVVVKSGGKILHSLSLGKTASASSQSYLRLDNSREVLLVSGNYRGLFDVTVESLQVKEESKE
ncbi:MAG TPA: DUF4340 domain-containing protein [Treponemataceae bacterium]|nr:DUF4340 domain-containing protein [Treponemataceae bacterium]